jgi:hypothetical protein
LALVCLEVPASLSAWAYSEATRSDAAYAWMWVSSWRLAFESA